MKGSIILVVGVVIALLVRSGFFEFEGDDMAAAWEVFPGVQKRIDTYMLRWEKEDGSPCLCAHLHVQ